MNSPTGLGLYPGDVILSKFWMGWGFPGTKEITCGPYRIESVHGPCTCAQYNTDWGRCSNLPSEPHFHLVCTDIRPLPSLKGRKGGSYLAGYVQREGRYVSVWPGTNPYTHELNGKPLDELFLVERAIVPAGTQLNLFAHA